DLLSREVGVGLVVESKDQKRQTELRVREHPYAAWHAGQGNLDGNGDLFLDLLRRASGIKSDHLDLCIGDVGKGLDRQVDERGDPGADEHDGTEQNEQRLREREGD